MLAAPLANLEFNNDNWLAEDHPTELALDRLAKVYEPGETLLVLLPLQQDFFSSASLREEIDRLENRLGALSRVMETSSPLSARLVLQLPDDSGEAENGEALPTVLEIGSFQYALEQGVLTSEPDTDSPNLSYRQAFERSPYAGRLLDADARLAAIQVRLDTRENHLARQQAMAEISALLDQEWGQQYWLVGAAAIKNELNLRLGSDTVRILLLAMLGTLILLRLLLGSWPRAVLIAVCAGGCTAVAMAWLPRLGLPATAPTLILPVMIITVGVADALHLLLRWDRERLTAASPSQAVVKTIRALWLPCLTASLTTAIGCGAFILSEILILSEFSLVAAVAVLTSYPLMIVPLMVALWLWDDSFTSRSATARRTDFMYSKLLAPVRLWGLERPQIGLLAVVLPCAFLAAGLYRLHTESNFLAIFFSPDEEIRQGFRLTDQKLGGSGTVDVLLESEQGGHFRQAESLRHVRVLEEALQIENINRVDSYAVPLRQVHPHLAQTGELPTSDNELEQEIFFLELSRNEEERGVLEPYSDFNYSASRLDVSTPDLLSRDLDTLIGRMTAVLTEYSGDLKVTLTGFGVFLHSLAQLILTTQLTSLSMTAGLVALIFLLQFGPSLALAGICANILPLAATAGLVSWLGLPYDFGTILVIGITTGFAVDDTLHLLHSYRYARGSAQEKLQLAVQKAGPAILAACLALGSGLLFLLSSDLVLIDRFALFAAFGLFVSLLCSLLMLPAAILLAHRLLRL